jgi:hypothetical protein
MIQGGNNVTNPPMVTYTVVLTEHNARLSWTDDEYHFKLYLNEIRTRQVPHTVEIQVKPSDPNREASIRKRYACK